MGSVVQPEVRRSNARSVLPSPSKSPSITFTPLVAAQPVILPAGLFSMRNVPSPFENAMGSVVQPEVRRSSARSVLPSPSKSSDNTSTPSVDTQLGTYSIGLFSILNPSSSSENAMGSVVQLGQPDLRRIKARSVRSSPLKSPSITSTLLSPSHLAKGPIGWSSIRKLPSPLEMARGRDIHWS